MKLVLLVLMVLELKVFHCLKEHEILFVCDIDAVWHQSSLKIIFSFACGSSELDLMKSNLDLRVASCNANSPPNLVWAS